MLYPSIEQRSLCDLRLPDGLQSGPDSVQWDNLFEECSSIATLANTLQPICLVKITRL